MEQNKDYGLSGRLRRIIRPLYQIKKIELKTNFQWFNENTKVYISIIKNKKIKEYILTMDVYENEQHDMERSVSVEGWDTWKENVDMFLELVKDKE